MCGAITMREIEQSALEAAVLGRLHVMHGGLGFPPANMVRVLRRESTGCGRYVDIESDAEIEVENGYLDLGGSFIEMEGVANGIMAVALVHNRRLTELEFSTYGGDAWNGDERRWKIV